MSSRKGKQYDGSYDRVRFQMRPQGICCSLYSRFLYWMTFPEKLLINLKGFKLNCAEARWQAAQCAFDRAVCSDVCIHLLWRLHADYAEPRGSSNFFMTNMKNTYGLCSHEWWIHATQRFNSDPAFSGAARISTCFLLLAQKFEDFRLTRILNLLYLCCVHPGSGVLLRPVFTKQPGSVVFPLQAGENRREVVFSCEAQGHPAPFYR